MLRRPRLLDSPLGPDGGAGLRFSRAYASPVCTPSRVRRHTRLYVSRHGHAGVLPVHHGSDKTVDSQKMPTYSQLM
jgi:arylsulfatase A-like enzyme